MAVRTYDFALPREQDQIAAGGQRCRKLEPSSSVEVQKAYLIAIDGDVDGFGFVGVGSTVWF